MASLLRQIVAGPRVRHPEAGLDLCYVTDNIIATSGPSQTYPQRAYRNPLDRLVEFLDSKHSDDWAIWEFRAEGTGYPDNLVYNRIRHYPWPDHHPPPFRLIPLIMASMRNWLNGNDPDAPVPAAAAANDGHHKDNKQHHLKEKIVDAWKENRKPGGGRRVAVVHCKAGKGRSGTVACCYLITECGWTPEEALARFTERRMRPRMGPGVSIPSQLRTVTYAERWARGGDDGAGRRRYVDRAVEILEIHVWGLRNGVKLAVEGYVDQGKKIRIFHTFTKKERYIVEGDPPSAGGGGGVVGMLYDMAGYGSAATPVPEQEVLDDARGGGEKNADSSPVVSPPDRSDTGTPSSMKSTKAKMGKRASKLISKVSRSSSRAQTPKPPADPDAKSPSTDPTGNESADSSPTSITSSALSIDRERQNQGSGDDSSSPANGNTDAETEPGGRAVIFKPRTTIRVPNSDVNITVERRNRAPSSMGLTMVTAVAHVWFNAYFEGRGPEQAGVPDDAGVFEIDWDKMDGIKGSSQKGTRAADRIAVVWRAVGPAGDDDEEAVPAPSPAGKVGVDRDEQPKEEKKEQETSNTPPSAEPDPEPEAGAAIPQMRPADWQGGEQTEQPPDAAERGLGLRTKSPDSADVSQASSIRAGDGDAVSELDVGSGGGVEGDGEDGEEDDDLRRVRSDVGLDGGAAGGGDGDAGVGVGVGVGMGGSADADEDPGKKTQKGDKALEAYAEKLPSPDGDSGGGGGGGSTGKRS